MVSELPPLIESGQWAEYQMLDQNMGVDSMG